MLIFSRAMLNLSALLFLLLLQASKSQATVIPTRFLVFDSHVVVSVNGSSEVGNCSLVTNEGSQKACESPATSVLFDGIIPTLSGLDGDTWASQLLTLNPPARFFQLSFTFPSGTQVQRVEVALFNCPRRGISVQFMEEDSAGTRSLIPFRNFSCDSLVRESVQLQAPTNELTLYFATFPRDLWTHLAELTFCNDTSSCSPDTIITTPQPDEVTTTPLLLDMETTAPATTGDTVWSNNTGTDNFTPTMSSSPTTIIAVVCVVCLMLLVVVSVVVVVLILWRHGRHRKHSNTHHTTPSRAAQSHPPITLCEETGQVYYSTVQELPQLSQQASEDTHYQDDTYSHIQRDQVKKKKATQPKQVINEGEYSTLSVYNGPPEAADQLYAQVDKKKKKKEEGAENDLPAADQLYAQVDKKKKKREANPEAVQQLYAQVDKQKIKEKSNAQESGALYAVVNKPKPPQISSKSDSLMEDLDK